MVRGLRELLLELCRALNKKGVQYMVIGGMAMMFHGFARFTEDIDLLIDPSPDNVARLKGALEELFHDDAIEEIKPSDLSEYAVVRYGTPYGFAVDLMGKVGELAGFNDMARYRQWHEIEGITVPLCSAEGLFKLKDGSLREKDKMDVKFLREKLKKERSDAGSG